MTSGIRLDDVVAKANEVTMGVLEDKAKSEGINTRDIAAELGVDRKTVRGWFATTMPYDVFLQVCKMLKTPATKIFDETRSRLKTGGAKAGETDGDDGGQVEDAGHDDDGDHGDDDVKMTPLGSDVNVDMSSPDSPPFDLISSEDAGLRGADGLIVDWVGIKREIMQKHKTEMTEDQYRRRFDNFPKPIKTSDKNIDLKFRSYKIKQGFVNMGLLNDLEEIGSRYGVSVSINDD